MCFKAVIIYGDPRYYSRFGFRGGERFEVKTSTGKYSTCLLVLPLKKSFFRGSSVDDFMNLPVFMIFIAKNWKSLINSFLL
jgi:hypothetical protein